MDKTFWQAYFDRRARTTADPVSAGDCSADGYWVRYRFVESIFRRISRPNATFLDCGCGIGQYLALGRQFGMNSIGLDMSTQALRTARSKGMNCCNGDTETLPFASGSCDMILSVGVMQYLDDAKASLQEFSRVLTLNGTAILVTLNRQSIRSILAVLTRTDPKNAYRLGALCTKARQCGMDVEASRYLYFFPRGLGLMAQSLNRHETMHRRFNLLANAFGIVMRKRSP